MNIELKMLLREMVDQDGSDLFLTSGAPPSMKAFGKMVPMRPERFEEGDVKRMAYGIMNEDQRRAFDKSPECNLAMMYDDIGRFRVNIFQQRGEVGMVCRTIKSDIPEWSTLGLPEVLTRLVMEKNGLILFVGGSGSGKSTSLASLIDFRNRHSSGHIITIEDPVEFLHQHQQSIVNQREVGIDTVSYEQALKNTLRQAPDVILIGEIRTEETMEHALAFAETGHLCLSTLHANNANQALERIINFFPEERHKQVYLDLSLNIRAIISQRLIPSVDGKRVAAIEILIGTPRIQELIKNGMVEEIKEVMEKSAGSGMRTFDAALYHLYSEGHISLEEALRNADSKNNLRLKITLAESDVAGKKAADLSGGLSLAPKGEKQTRF